MDPLSHGGQVDARNGRVRGCGASARAGYGPRGADVPRWGASRVDKSQSMRNHG